MKHIIRKQIIELDLDAKADAFRIQHLVSRYNQKEIIPVLQKVFDRLTRPDEIISLDRFEIDLGVLSADQLERGKHDILLEPAIFSSLSKLMKSTPAKQEIVKEPSAVHISRQWLFYMQKGWLPWNTLVWNQEKYDEVLETLATDYRMAEQLRSLIRLNEKAVWRIIYQHPESFLITLVELLSARSQEKLPAMINEINRAHENLQKKHTDKERANERAFKNNVWRKILGWVAAKSGQSAENLAEKIIRHFFNGNEMTALLGEPMIHFETTRPIWERLGSLKTVDEEVLSERIDNTPKIEKPDSRESVDQDGIYLVNAGTVLLHPFLPHLFKNLQIWSGQEFTDSAAHQKSLFILHYLATGSTDPEEYELAISKILCGFPLDEPVEKNIPLSEEEKAEANALLDAVILEWKILKNTSPRGLQESFLQRNGKLVRRNDHLYLLVESLGIDALLDHLPWNLSIISLPWMKELLRVEWR